MRPCDLLSLPEVFTCDFMKDYPGGLASHPYRALVPFLEPDPNFDVEASPHLEHFLFTPLREQDGDHLLISSMFCKEADDDKPPYPKITRDFCEHPERYGVKCRKPPMSYVKPYLENAKAIRRRNKGVDVGIFLAADMDWLADELLDAGVRVFQCHHSSTCHNVGATWRILGSDMRNYTFISQFDSEDVENHEGVDAFIRKTKLLPQVGCAVWGSPAGWDKDAEGLSVFRAAQCGRVGFHSPSLEGLVFYPRILQFFDQFESLPKTCNHPKWGQLPLFGYYNKYRYGGDESVMQSTIIYDILHAGRGMAMTVPVPDHEQQGFQVFLDYAHRCGPVAFAYGERPFDHLTP